MEEKSKFVYDKICEEMRNKFGEEIKALIAYGSYVCAKPTKTSMFDLWCIVKNYKSFYKKFFEHKKFFPSIWPFTEGGQVFLNKVTRLNYYRDEIVIEEDDEAQQKKLKNLKNKRQADSSTKNKFKYHQTKYYYKYAVMSLSDFIYTCKKSKKMLAVKGKFQKPVEIIYCDGDVEEINDAINTAREEAVSLSLNLLKKDFTFDELLRKVVELSYLADFRPESPKKIDEIYQCSFLKLKEIYTPIVEKFTEAKIIGKIDEKRFRNLKFKEGEKEKTEKYLKEVSKFALLLNVKGFFNFGPVDSIAYLYRKIKRWLE